MKKGAVLLTAILAVVAVLAAILMQPSYFFAKPSALSLFSALVADRGVTVERDLSFGPGKRLKLDVYSPESRGQADQSPIIIFYYGGTWKEGDKSIYGFLGAALASRGITTVIPDYRLHPDVHFPTFIEDAAAAYAWTARHFSARQRRIIVMGHSAGAHMAAMLAFNPGYINATQSGVQAPLGLIGLAGPYAYDLTTYPTTRDLFPAGTSASQTVPANFVTADAPPALLVHGADDDTVKLENQKVLAARLQATGVSVETHVPDGVTHVGLIRNLAWPFRNHSPLIDQIVHFTQQRAKTLKP